MTPISLTLAPASRTDTFSRLIFSCTYSRGYRGLLAVLALAYWVIHHDSSGAAAVINGLLLPVVVFMGAAIVHAAFNDRPEGDHRFPATARIIIILAVVWYGTMLLPPWKF